MGLARRLNPLFKRIFLAVLPVKTVSKHVDLLKSKVKEEIVAVQKSIQVLVIVILISLLFFIFLSVTFGLVLSYWLDSYIFGFGLVSLLYLFALILYVRMHYEEAEQILTTDA